jgi:NAD-dependent dihydropyrimidine dehydrogenase PreA subunit
MISAVGIIVTLVVIWGGGKKIEGSIEARLRAGDEKFKEIAEVCKNHSIKLSDLEVKAATDEQELHSDTSCISRLSEHVGKIENRVTAIEAKDYSGYK